MNFSSSDHTRVYNHLVISDALHTSGQPTPAQFQAIKEAGFTHVINLAPSHTANSLKKQPQILEKLGLRYTYIPVDFKAPNDEDFAAFTTAMSEKPDEKIWVHCQANMRVSAFIYRYRCETLGEDEATAREDILKIWEPFGVWKKFTSWPG